MNSEHFKYDGITSSLWPKESVENGPLYPDTTCNRVHRESPSRGVKHYGNCGKGMLFSFSFSTAFPVDFRIYGSRIYKKKEAFRSSILTAENKSERLRDRHYIPIQLPGSIHTCICQLLQYDSSQVPEGEYSHKPTKQN